MVGGGLDYLNGAFVLVFLAAVGFVVTGGAVFWLVALALGLVGLPFLLRALRPRR